jgi:hypothetical protein
MPGTAMLCRYTVADGLKPVAYILVRLLLQYKYTGIPASRITKPKALLLG